MNSGIIIQVRIMPYDVWEKLEECQNLENAYERLDELENEAKEKKYPSNYKNYRIGYE